MPSWLLALLDWRSTRWVLGRFNFLLGRALLMITMLLTLLSLGVVNAGNIIAGAFGKTIEPALLLDALSETVLRLDGTQLPAVDPLDRQAAYTRAMSDGIYADIIAAKIPQGMAKGALAQAHAKITEIETAFAQAVAAGGTPIS